VNSFIIILPSFPDIHQYICHRILGCDAMWSAKWPPAAYHSQIIVRQKHYDLSHFAWCLWLSSFSDWLLYTKCICEKKICCSLFFSCFSIFTHHFSIFAAVISYLAKTRHTHGISVNSHNQAMK